MAFERVHGPLSLHDRIDHAAARICWAIEQSATGGNSERTPADFMPIWDAAKQQETRLQPVEDMIATMRQIQKRKKSS